MNLFSSQVSKFPTFNSLLERDLLLFVQGNPSVCEAVIQHGMRPPINAARLWASHASLRAIRESRPLLLRTMSPATDPLVMLMTFSTAGGDSDWLGYFTPSTGYITIYKPLVETWEALEAAAQAGTITAAQEGNRILLYRNTVALVLHELLHFFNEQLYPQQKINTEKNHFSRFGGEAFGPLGWERADYEGFQEVLEFAGVPF